MSEADYAKLVMTSVMHGGGRHNHGSGNANPDSMPGMDHGAMPRMHHAAPDTSLPASDQHQR